MSTIKALMSLDYGPISCPYMATHTRILQYCTVIYGSVPFCEAFGIYTTQGLNIFTIVHHYMIENGYLTPIFLGVTSIYHETAVKSKSCVTGPSFPQSYSAVSMNHAATFILLLSSGYFIPQTIIYFISMRLSQRFYSA